ncbi:RIPOR family member 3 [Puma concolor]|uniref:RIPOR family member 3 n=1 Tax=Puma concolor TaxID=9696 RepID=A0A6P6IM26_PUMCO|nr:RIPOR family member 3 [Puma concolor]
MSVRLRFLSSGDAGAVGVVGRSASFAGFSSAQSRRIAAGAGAGCLEPVFKGRISQDRSGDSCKDLTLETGLGSLNSTPFFLGSPPPEEYLCTQQAELDYLSGRHKDTRRNSRLAFYYDLDKVGETFCLRPFDTESFLVSPSPTGKFSMGSRKGSLYNWTPPSTPSFRERYYLSVLQRPAQQALLLGGPKAPPILGYLSDSDLRGSGLRSRSQELPEMDSFSSEDPRDTETSTSASTSDVGLLPVAIGPNTSIEEEAQEDPRSLGLLPEMAHLAGGSFVEQPGWRNLGIEAPSLPRGSPFHNHTVPGSQKDDDEGEAADGADGPGVTLERPLQEVLDLLRSMDTAQPQLRELEYQVLGCRDRLKPRGARQEHASSESLMECILESFAFLNADLAPQELSLCGGCQGPRKDRSPPPLPPRTASPQELTAGTPELDMLLTVHLHVCKTLLQKLASPNLSRMVQECLLEEAVQQKQVLEMLSVLDFEKVSKAASIEEIVPQATRRKGCLKLWRGCTEPGRVLSCSGTTLLNQLKKTFLHRVRGKYPGQLEIACRRLLEQVVSCGGLLPGAGLPEEQTVTWFQFHSYLQRQGVSDLEKHFAQLTKEVTLAEELQCAGQVKTIRKLQGKRLGQLQPLPQTLRAWALLQLDGTPRVCRAASARLASAARNQSFREKIDELIKVDSTCYLKCPLMGPLSPHLKQGIESIDQIASLCQSDLEAVRTAAREATLSFGEKGRSAFEKMDKLCLEPRGEAFCQEADIEITVF